MHGWSPVTSDAEPGSSVRVGLGVERYAVITPAIGISCENSPLGCGKHSTSSLGPEEGTRKQCSLLGSYVYRLCKENVWGTKSRQNLNSGDADSLGKGHVGNGWRRVRDVAQKWTWFRFSLSSVLYPPSQQQRRESSFPPSFLSPLDLRQQPWRRIPTASP